MSSLPSQCELPAVLEAERRKTRSERVVGLERPAAHLSHARFAGEPHGLRQVGIGVGKRDHGVPATDEETDTVEVEALTVTPEPREMVSGRVREHVF